MTRQRRAVFALIRSSKHSQGQRYMHIAFKISLCALNWFSLSFDAVMKQILWFKTDCTSGTKGMFVSHSVSVYLM
jgi:hypothetical protein